MPKNIQETRLEMLTRGIFQDKIAVMEEIIPRKITQAMRERLEKQ
jgi:hypothetical protein